MTEKHMTVLDIMKGALGMLGADGLCNTTCECGCGLEDFLPCGEGPYAECEAAKRVRCETGEYAGEEIYVPLHAERSIDEDGEEVWTVPEKETRDAV